MSPPARGPALFHGVTRNVVALGVVSMLTDVSSEMIVPILPLFVTATLGASVTRLGVIEGVAESTASLLRLWSGWLSDRAGRRLPFLVAGYGLSTVAKASFAVAGSWLAVLGLRFADRFGKGVRNPPRDALIADSVEPPFRGRAYGVHRALDTLGAAIGPLVAYAMLQAWPGDYRRVFLASAIPGALSLLVLLAFVRRRRRRDDPVEPAPSPQASGAAGASGRLEPLGAPFRRFLLVDGLFQLGNSSMAFVLLRASQAGIVPAAVPLVYLGYNLVYASLSLPVGALSDRIGRRRLLFAAYLLYAFVYALLAWRAGVGAVVVAFAVLGLHSALLEVSQRSLVADLVPEARRGTAFGVYHMVVGLALLPASVVAGWLWERAGAAATFGFGAACAALAALAFLWLLPSRHEHRDRHAHAA